MGQNDALISSMQFGLTVLKEPVICLGCSPYSHFSCCLLRFLFVFSFEVEELDRLVTAMAGFKRYVKKQKPKTSNISLPSHRVC